MAEITALQNYQKEILGTLDSMVAGNVVLTALDGLTSGGGNNGLGGFPEAVSLSNTYNNVMQSMITNFKEITALVTAMASVLGKSAQSYTDTETQLTDQFNKIVTQYESQSGGFTTPGSPTPSSPGQPTPQGGTSGAYTSATPASGTTGGGSTTGYSTPDTDASSTSDSSSSTSSSSDSNSDSNDGS